MSTQKAFSYFLYHRPTGLKYYGIRHAKNCHPGQLWTTYFSSSKVVKKLIKEYGTDSFEYSVRRTFETSQQALLWEHRVLSRLDAAGRSDWINRHNGGSKFRAPESHSDATKRVIAAKLLGRVFSEGHKAKISESSLKDRQARRDSGWTMPKDATARGLTTRAQRIAEGTINPYSAERNAKMAASKKGTKRQYLPDGSFVMVRVQQDQ